MQELSAIERPPLAIVPFPGDQRSDRIRPLISADARPHYDALTRGQLLLQQCGGCQRQRLPAAPVCPWCDSALSAWVASPGTGKVHSWVRYHRSFLTEFDALVPYEVVSVELDEGPFVIGRLLKPVDGGALAMGARTQAVVEQWSDGFCGLAFTLAGDAP